MLLLAAAAAALVWVNAPFGDSYDDFWGTRATLDLRFVDLRLMLVEWVNDGLMTLFFFVVGLEIKREVLRGELASRQRAVLPIAAAIGGMAAPAGIYLLFNAGGGGATDGWGIPMATDIAFAVGVLALLGPRVPIALKVFLLALAIADDLGAITVIAIFYTDDLQLGWLALAAGLLALTAALGRGGMRSVFVYLGIGVVVWLAVHESGVHATIAGVALGLLMPIGADTHAAADRQPLVERLEHTLHPWTSFVIIPIFALANAGVELGGGAIGAAATSPVALGVAAGLTLGKPLGITVFAWLAVRSGLAALPDGVRWPQIIGVSMVAGIGFTVSIFIANLAFADAALVDEAKIGILAGSAVVGGLGLAVLAWTGSRDAATGAQ